MTVLLRWLALDGVSEWWGVNSEYVDGPDSSKCSLYIWCILRSYWFCVKKHEILRPFWTFSLKRLACCWKMSYLCIRFREQKSRGHYERVHWKIYIDSSSTRADALVLGWARLGRTLKNRRFCHPFAVGKSIQVSGTTIDLGARPDGIMPQGIKLLAFWFLFR